MRGKERKVGKEVREEQDSGNDMSGGFTAAPSRIRTSVCVAQ